MENNLKILLAENNDFGQSCMRMLNSYGYSTVLVDKDGAQVLTGLRFESLMLLLWMRLCFMLMLLV